MAVFAPMPSASEAAAMAVNIGLRRRVRTANRRSRHISRMIKSTPGGRSPAYQLHHRRRRACANLGRAVRRGTARAPSSRALPGLSRLARGPAVGRHRIPPKYFSAAARPLRSEYLAHQRQLFLVRSGGVAVGPIAAVEHAILTEDAADGVQPVAVEGHILTKTAIHAPQHLRDLHVHLLTRRKFPPDRRAARWMADDR